jgi:hypothetical protein
VVQTAFIHKLYKCVLPLVTNDSLRTVLTQRATACSKTRTSNTSSRGPPPTRASSCRLPTNFRKS